MKDDDMTVDQTLRLYLLKMAMEAGHSLNECLAWAKEAIQFVQEGDEQPSFVPEPEVTRQTAPQKATNMVVKHKTILNFKNKHWSKEDEDKLIQMARLGLPARNIGKQLGRSQSSVFNRMMVLRRQGKTLGRYTGK